MIIIGAKGHALEVFDQITNQSNVGFYDDVNVYSHFQIKNKPLITSKEELMNLNHKEFVLGLGGVKSRLKVYERFLSYGLEPLSVISKSAQISPSAVLSDALNIMALCFIGPQTKIGLGSLINAMASVHHDSTIGNFVELGPGVKVLGNVNVGDHVFIGSNATILPHVNIGHDAIIGAGAVVVKDVAAYTRVKGIPAQQY